jgi:hypothetical protein
VFSNGLYMVIAKDNARRWHGAVTFLLRVEIISEIFEELKLVRSNGNTVASGVTRWKRL